MQGIWDCPNSGEGESEPFLLYTANNFRLIYSRKRISQNSFPNFIYIFPKSFMIFCQELSNLKRNYENQIWTYRLPRISSWKSNKHIFSLKSNTYFWWTVMFVQDVFLYLIVTRNKLTVYIAAARQCLFLTATRQRLIERPYLGAAAHSALHRCCETLP